MHKGKSLISVGFIAVACLVAVAIVARNTSRHTYTRPPARETVAWECTNAKYEYLWDPRYHQGLINGVVTSTSSPWRIYVTKDDLSLYLGEGDSDYIWRKLSTRIPGNVYTSAGTTRDTLYAGSPVFVSNNLGRSWKSLICDRVIVTSVSVSIKDPRKLYVFSDIPDYPSAGLDKGGLYISSNGGKTWLHMTDYYPPAMQRISSQRDLALEVGIIAMHPRSMKSLYLSTQLGGILLSRDSGRSWSYSAIDKQGEVVLGIKQSRIVPTSIEVGAGVHPDIWVVTEGGNVYRGDDTISHWQLVRDRKDIDDIAPDTNLRNIVLAVSKKGVVLRSIDRGKHWMRVKGLGHGPFLLTVNPLNSIYYAWTGYGKIYRSRDHGVTWTKLPPLPK